MDNFHYRRSIGLAQSEVGFHGTRPIDKEAHCRGLAKFLQRWQAVDIGHPEAAAWLSAHGAGFGLCRVYRNEPWHFELRPAATSQGCPPLYADPTHDPRMQG